MASVSASHATAVGTINPRNSDVRYFFEVTPEGGDPFNVPGAPAELEAGGQREVGAPGAEEVEREVVRDVRRRRVRSDQRAGGESPEVERRLDAALHAGAWVPVIRVRRRPERAHSADPHLQHLERLRGRRRRGEQKNEEQADVHEQSYTQHCLLRCPS